jgi:predicted alpha-1,2-mannosidase
MLGAAACALALLAGTVGTAVPAAAAGLVTDPGQYVNPFLGTQPGAVDHGTGGGAGNNFPGADVPFGMVQWSPDTVTGQPGGYYYQDNRIKGFSLTHLSGAGCTTYQDIPFMPYVGEVTDSPASNPGKYVSTFSHANEKASPGSYDVKLDNGVRTELTATQRTGAGRMTFPAGDPSTLLVNTSGSVSGVRDSQVTIGRDSISGWAASGKFCGADDTYRVYFYAKFDQKFASVGTWRDGKVTPGKTSERGKANAKVPANKYAAHRPATNSVTKNTAVSGPGSGGYVTFDSAKNPVVNVHLGLSFVSIGGAQKNLRAEGTGNSFDKIKSAAQRTWNDRLSEIKVGGGTTEQKRTFYSSLYHAYLQPNVFNDVDGRYAGFDGQLHQAPKGRSIYTNFSGWDIYRSEVPLLSVLAPKEMSDIAYTMIQFAEQGGSWDRWTVANDYTGVMNGDPYHIIVSDAYAFGAKKFDAHNALLSMVHGATQPSTGYVERPGLANYQKLGYVPNAAADTLEYTSADFSIAQLAHRLGDNDTYNAFMKRAQNWQNLFNPATKYLQPRNSDGSFAEPFDPASSAGWVEGNGAQYTWMVPYDYAGLVTAFGGDAAVNKRLDTFHEKLNVGTGSPYAFLSNEPNSETPYIYDFTGAPAKTQALTRRVMGELFNSGAAGLQGNDDLGQMAAWYVWSAMGIYPEIPGRAELVTGSPIFTKVQIDAPGKKFTINAPGSSADNQYVSGLKVNGHNSSRPWVPESFVNTGGTLDFTMTDASTTWGSAAKDAPPSFHDGEAAQRTFVEPSRVVIPAGGAGTTDIGAQDLSGQGAKLSWAAQPPNGFSVTPASGNVTVPSGQSAGVAVKVTVAAGTADGTYRIPISFSANGKPLPGTSLTVLVAEPGSLRAAYNNVGISSDSRPDTANLDGDGFAYSAEQLAAKGLTPGATVTADGISHTWPDVPLADPDNVQASGQKIDVTGTGKSLAFLGSATNGDTSGTATITYTDGSTQNATVGFSDWTLGGGGGQPAFGNRIVATTPYRNSNSGTPQQIDTYVFATAPIALQAGKTVASVTLPKTDTGGALHIFTVAVG